MKKLIALLFIAGIFASCGKPVTMENSTSTDTMTVSMDSVSLDSVIVDSSNISIAVDSVK